MKKTFLILLALAAMFGSFACEKQVDENDLPNDDSNISNDDSYILPENEIDADEQFEEQTNNDEPQIETVASFTSSVNNNLNGGMILEADDYIVFCNFVENPEDEYSGGEYRLYRAKKDFSEPEVIYEPYFSVRNMCIYDNKLYFTTGGGGGRHLIELDLSTLENKELHDNLSQDYGFFVDGLQLVDGMLYFECNGNICRMKPDQSDFEVLRNGENDFSASLLGVVSGYVFYRNYTTNEIRRIDIESGEDTAIIENFIDGCINFYDGRMYYTDGKSLISSDLDGIEKRTVFELDGDERFNALNISDGYVYYVVNTFLNDTQSYAQNNVLCEYNLNGGDKRILREDSYIYQLTVVGGKLYFYETYSNWADNVLKELDPKNAELRTPCISNQ